MKEYIRNVYGVIVGAMLGFAIGWTIAAFILYFVKILFLGR